MKREWQPGDVAMVEGFAFVPSARVAIVRKRTRPIGHDLEFAYVEGGFDMVEDLAEGFRARPLVVIDPEDREQVERLNSLFWSIDLLGRSNPDRLQAALREFADPTPPKPEEPEGLGAVVEDIEGISYIRAALAIRECWLHEHSGNWLAWSDIPAPVRVLWGGIGEES